MKKSHKSVRSPQMLSILAAAAVGLWSCSTDRSQTHVGAASSQMPKDSQAAQAQAQAQEVGADGFGLKSAATIRVIAHNIRLYTESSWDEGCTKWDLLIAAPSLTLLHGVSLESRDHDSATISGHTVHLISKTRGGFDGVLMSARDGEQLTITGSAKGCRSQLLKSINITVPVTHMFERKRVAEAREGRGKGHYDTWLGLLLHIGPGFSVDIPAPAPAPTPAPAPAPAPAP
ncbi:MAG: hypothetical protein NTZ90_12890, partial [Proteobacteria bacterium]|nr:hypothetical protein [Pseudomonadota bacterium]